MLPKSLAHFIYTDVDYSISHEVNENSDEEVESKLTESDYLVYHSNTKIL